MVDVTAKAATTLSAVPVDDLVSFPFGADRRVAASWFKRLFDAVIAFVVLLLFCPLLLTIAVATRLESGESALVSQKRTGFRGRVFTLYRFRTSVLAEPSDRPQRPQTTFVGQMLLALSLDELPQIWNVLRGDMSLVGPRPHDVADDEINVRLVDRYAERFRARPGLTGLSQISGLRGEAHQVELMRERIAADNRYIENWSFALDLAILARTATVLRDHQV